MTRSIDALIAALAPVTAAAALAFAASAAVVAQPILSSGDAAPSASSASASSADPDALWLEDVHGSRALAWVRERNGETTRRVAADPRYDAEVKRFERLGQGAGSDDYLSGGYVHRVLRDAKHPLGTWQVMRADDSGDRHWQDAISFDALAEREGLRWQFRPGWLNPVCDSKLGSRCLLALSPDGGDRTVLREFDLAAGRFVGAAEGGFAIATPARTYVAWVDRDTVMVSSDFGAGSMSEAGYAIQARLWKRGQPLAQAKLVFEAPKGAVLFIPHAMKTEGPTLFLAEVWPRGADSPEYWLLHLDAPATKLQLPAPVVQYRGIVGMLRGKLIAMTAQPAVVGGRSVRTGSLLAVPLDGNGPTRVIFEPTAAEAIDPIFHLAMARDSLWFVAMRDVDAHLYSAVPQGGRWRVVEHALPAHAAVQMLTGENTQGVVMAKVESLLRPPTTTLYGIGKPPDVIDRAPALFDASAFTSEQRFAISADGTRVPYYLVRPKAFSFDGHAAGLISAYGGFGVSWLPAYANHEFKTDIGLPLLERGAVFVQANIRGGGEYGPAWHDAARRTKRQNGLDDLAAVAHDLVRIGAVAPNRLAMIGGSNGGLLAAATGIQRPSLFKALIAEVPLTDMLRFHNLYTGSVWINEYGDPDDPVERAALARYSPLQNVKPGVSYPEMLLVTSTADDRVHPGHARRLAERLRSVGQPVLFFEATEGGHESLSALRPQAELRAMETIYLLQALKLP